MNCPKCSSKQRAKSVKVKGIEHYKCKECGCHYSVESKSTAKSKYGLQNEKLINTISFCRFFLILSELWWVRLGGITKRNVQIKKNNAVMTQ
jgi:Zn ribbon nucleic-acid-binding protein